MSKRFVKGNDPLAIFVTAIQRVLLEQFKTTKKMALAWIQSEQGKQSMRLLTRRKH